MDIRQLFEKKKGVAGIDLLLQVVSALFVLGILVMIFVIMGSRLGETVDPTDPNAPLNDTTAFNVINETKVSISDAVDFNSIIIIMALMVVLILLVTIIVRQVRSSGMMGTA